MWEKRYCLEDHNGHLATLAILSQVTQLHKQMLLKYKPVNSIFSTAAQICNGTKSSLTSNNFEQICDAFMTRLQSRLTLFVRGSVSLQRVKCNDNNLSSAI